MNNECRREIARLSHDVAGGARTPPTMYWNVLFAVLNFFPVPVTEECLSDDSRRTGKVDGNATVIPAAPQPGPRSTGRFVHVRARVAVSAGLCLNAYECRIQKGESHGPCALGFGVCCVCK